jgi:hypothetical protein
MSCETDRLIRNANVRAGLVMLPLGLLSGLAMSLYAFHPIVKSAWVYDDLPRRLLRLGHIAAVMLPLVNIIVGPWIDRLSMGARARRWTSGFLIWGAVGLPLALAAEAFVPALRPLHPSGLPAAAFTLGTLLMGAAALRTSGGRPGTSSPPYPRSAPTGASSETTPRCPSPLAK